MGVKIEFHDGRSVEYENAVRVADSKNDYVLFDESGAVLAHVHKYDVKNLHTKDPDEKW
ncbi:hypothetical protein DFS21_11089 [Pseudomonas sp. 2848]|uniref:hypothetical protein n=1 Tax=unclassified Pseudomonas TaxID=196821 RepID=UPI000DB00757|nr:MULTISPECIES: hypothetical protein [unclassified Pseudomonas]PZW76637.1 hypothetical protein DFS21_11089 [Pseudomonas sp. 2848]